jgi:hypothetical protein
MIYETIEDLVKEFKKSHKQGADGILLRRNEKVFRKMSFEELNERLKPYGLKCLIDDLNCCSFTHDHYICKIDYVPPFPISSNDHRLPTTK